MTPADEPCPGSVEQTVGPGTNQAARLDETIAPSETAQAALGETVAGRPLQAGAVGGTIDFVPQPMGFNATIDSIASMPATSKASVSAAVRPQVEGFSIQSELGRGGMGVVYKARQTKLNRTVALKMVLAGAHAGAEQLARFHAEAEAVAHLQHPHIVQIYEVGEHGGLPFFSLEFVDGGCLADRIGGKPQPVDETAHQVELLARAMAYAHEQGIVHRDLKPANVLLTKDGQPKITDFGLAKRLESDSSQTKSGTLMGTPSYMAPEQARGEVREVGPLADVYALGVILYEMLTGRTPFIGASILDTLQQVRNKEPVPPTQLLPKIPRDLETICLRCLQKDPHKRYASALALADDLRRFQAGEPILARRVGRVERVWRWCKRNPRVAALSAAVVVLLMASGGALGLAAVRQARERETLGQVRIQGGERIKQAREEIESGNLRRAQDLLSWTDPLIESRDALQDVRTEFHDLKAQVGLYAELKRLADEARFHGLFGARGTLAEAQRHCRELIELHQALEQETGKAASGLPPLAPAHRQLLQEDIFETYVLAAHVESELAATAKDESAKKAAAEQAIKWLATAEKLLPPTRMFYRRRSEFWKTLGDTAAAQADVERAEQIKPDSVVDRFWNGVNEHQLAEAERRRGNLKGMQERYKSAIAEYAALLRIRPDHYWTYFDWAWCQMQLSEPYGAIVGFTTCIQLKPEISWPYYNRGNVFWQLKQSEAAIQDFDAAIERNGRYADAYYNRGVVYTALGKLDEALGDCGRAIEINPSYTLAHYQRGEILRSQKKHDEAIASYGQAITLSPTNSAAYSGRGASFFSKNDYGKAREDFAKVIQLQPKQPTGYRMRAIATLYLKDFQASLTDWGEFSKLQPASPDPHYYSALIYKALRKYPEALAALEKAMAKKPDESKYFLTRAQIYQQQGRYEEALAERNRVLPKAEANKADVLNDRADAHRALGRLDEAAADYQASIELNPKQIDGYIGLALIRSQRGEHDQAAAHYDEMVAADPDSAAVYIRRAEHLRNVGKYEAACADCDRAASLDAKSLLPPLVRASIDACQGKPANAIAAVNTVFKKEPALDGNCIYAAACVWSLASKAFQEAGEQAAAAGQSAQAVEKAATLLAEAWEKGFLDLSYQQYNRTADDPALAPIMDHPTVRQLLALQP
jgi:tetratricopeptide (TPR) repeat protein/tRNA A-37 threonylcarbamoyl transferase component Bud32